MQKSRKFDRELLCYLKKRIINRISIKLSREPRRVKYLNLIYTYIYIFEFYTFYIVKKRKVSSIIYEIIKRLYI